MNDKMDTKMLEEYIESHDGSMIESYIYMISDGTAVKIGVSKYIGKRINQLQTGNPRQLELIAYGGFTSEESVYKFESAFHITNNSKRLLGEWFDLSIVNLCKIFLQNEAYMFFNVTECDKVILSNIKTIAGKEWYEREIKQHNIISISVKMKYAELANYKFHSSVDSTTGEVEDHTLEQV